MYEHLLVPVDGSELCDKAIEHSIGLAKMLGASITGFTAEPPLPVLVVEQAAVAYDVETFQEHEKRCEAHAREILLAFAEKARQAGVAFDGQFVITDNVQQAIVDMADAVGSTSQLINAAKTLPNQQLIVATDRGIFYKMQQAVPEKELLEAPTAGEGATCRSCAHCPWMAMNGLKAIAEGLETGGAAHEIHVDAALREGALVPLNRMLDFAATLRT